MKLTQREKEVCDLLKLAYDDSEIARSLHISLHTVRAHLKSIHLKLGVRSRSKLLAILILSEHNIALLGKLKIDNTCIKYKAEIDKINEEHYQILCLLEKFLLVSESPETNFQTGYFKKLVSEHFRNEEELLKAIKCEELPQHKIDHRSLENIIDKALSSDDFKSAVYKIRKVIESHMLDWDMKIRPPCTQ